MYEDAAARHALLTNRTLPTAPGALASAAPAIAENDIYDVSRLRLIFYDNPIWGPYRGRFKRIFATPRYHDLHANLRHFVARYAAVPASSANRLRGERALFQNRYNEYVALEAAKLNRQLERLEGAGIVGTLP